MICFLRRPDMGMVEKLRRAMITLGGSRLNQRWSGRRDVMGFEENWLVQECGVRLYYENNGVLLEGPKSVIDCVRELVPPADD